MKSFLFILLLFPITSQGIEQTAYLAGGCFWCVEADLEPLVGVKKVVSGFSGGDKSYPKYKDVAYGKTKHREAVKVVFDNSKISYQKIIEVFLRGIDPTDEGGQFVDRGYQYSPAIYYQINSDKITAIKELKKIEPKFNRKIKVKVEKFKSFYPAEEYHQDYYKKSTIKYKYYRYRSGRDQFLNKYWK